MAICSENLTEKKNTVCIYGAIVYVTIFKEAVSTHFCYWITPTGRRVLCPAQDDMD